MTTATKKYSVNSAIDEDTDIKFNHVGIFFENGRMEISGLFECKKIETAYNRFRKIMQQLADAEPLFKGWDNWLPAKKITADSAGGWYDACGELQPDWLNENGDFIFGDGHDCLRVDINEDTFYLYGFFSIPADEYAVFTDKFGEIKSLNAELIPQAADDELEPSEPAIEQFTDNQILAAQKLEDYYRSYRQYNWKSNILYDFMDAYCSETSPVGYDDLPEVKRLYKKIGDWADKARDKFHAIQDEITLLAERYKGVEPFWSRLKEIDHYIPVQEGDIIEDATTTA